MFTVALLSKSPKTRNNPISSSGKWIHIHTIKRNELVRAATTWMNQKHIMLNERRQTERLHIILFHLHDTLKKAKHYGDKNQIKCCQKPEVKGEG